MRIHRADKNAPMSELEYQVGTRHRLYEKYSDCFRNSKTNKRESINIFNNAEYENFLEFYVLDNAVAVGKNGQNEKCGIIDTYNKTHNKTQGIGLGSIREIINKHDKEVEDYIEHYGLRWFEKIVYKNGGYFFIKSPVKSENGKTYDVSNYYINSYDIIQGYSNDYPSYVTDYNVILPINYKCNNHSENVTICDGGIFGNIVETKNVRLHIVDVTQKGEKKECFNNLFNEMNQVGGNENDLLHLRVNVEDFGIAEIVAKAIFKYIYNDCKIKHIAVDFNSHRELIGEFVRIFTIFYDKSNNADNYLTPMLSKYQIALCSNNIKNSNCKEVNFIIAGGSLLSAYNTARVFLYYNSESTSEFVYLLDYLLNSNNDVNGDDNSAVIQFPFDLYLSQNVDSNSLVDPWENSWFLNRINAILDTDITKKDYGCKIDNIHIRLSSRIHVNEFYEAELLFHNIGNVYRFAYLIAQKIIKAYESNNNTIEKHILIYGYEECTSVLVQKICEIVKTNLIKKLNSNGVSSVVYSVKNEGELSFIDSSKEDLHDKNIDCFTVIPVGTTFSTVYKIQHMLNHILRNINFNDNYCIVAVKDKSQNTLSEECEYEECKYIEKRENKTAVLKQCKASKNSAKETRVHCLLEKEVEWRDAVECDICKGNNMPLLQVDKASILPSIIFELDDIKRKTFVQSQTENDNRIKKLAPKLKITDKEYVPVLINSHICREQNHYQFYCDFARYVENNSEEIVKWAKRLKIENNAFNIVLSPLSITNSKFLKIVIDNAFSSSLRFMHIDIDGTFKENARTRFSYISQEYKLIKETNPSAKVNIYFVDDSIVTGQTLNRAKTFIRMLLSESGLASIPAIYKKVILLINRSSFETANTFVEDPETNMEAYMHISIPPFNTKGDICPSCILRENYILLGKRSASSKLAQHYEKIAEKHKKRTLKEYYAWSDDMILNKHKGLAMLKVWLYHCADEQNDGFIRKLKNDMIQFMINKTSKVKDEDKDSYLEEIGSGCLNDFFDFVKSNANNPDEYKKKTVNIVKYLIERRAYLRMYSLHKSYVELFKQVKDDKSLDKIQRARERILNVIKDIIKEYCPKGVKKKSDMLIATEVLISCLKVISREQLSNYYHIRRAIWTVMRDILAILNGEQQATLNFADLEFLSWIKFNGESNKRRTPNNSLCAELQYEINITIFHRLSMLQYYDLGNLQARADGYANLVDKFFFENAYGNDFNDGQKEEVKRLTELPSSSAVVKSYMVTLKTATMLTPDDAPSFRILNYVRGDRKTETPNE